jgi:hypothetical protein
MVSMGSGATLRDGEYDSSFKHRQTVGQNFSPRLEVNGSTASSIRKIIHRVIKGPSLVVCGVSSQIHALHDHKYFAIRSLLYEEAE